MVLKENDRTSLVAQWLRTCLPMQGTGVRALVQEDPTCCGATKPVRHNYWACALEPVLRSKRSHHNKGQPPLAPTRESPRGAMKTQHSQSKTKKKNDSRGGVTTFLKLEKRWKLILEPQMLCFLHIHLQPVFATICFSQSPLHCAFWSSCSWRN